MDDSGLRTLVEVDLISVRDPIGQITDTTGCNGGYSAGVRVERGIERLASGHA